ncbi:GNAT family N-acetyltransferase [Polaribacter sp.]|nr:GNAT family N-acetyltransferase [Polaribacter sp.]
MEISIRKARPEDITQLAVVGKKAFYEAHKNAIPTSIMENYLSESFNKNQLLKEISNPNFQYHVLYNQDKLVGFSKVIFNFKNKNTLEKNITKMERLYFLEEYHGLGLGKKLFDFNINLIKENNQKGVWLYVWIKNYKALRFYEKRGFKKIGDYNFPVSETETRPNNVMFLQF